MSAELFAPSLAVVLGYEGGFVDDPRDPGGATNLGVDLATLSQWRGRPCSVADVRALTRADVEPLYRPRYWDLVRGDALPAGVDLLAFDGAVNQGPHALAQMLQRAAGVAPDGELGPVTMAAIGHTTTAELLERVRLERLAAYQADPGYEHDGKGWLRRLAGVAATASSWAAKAKGAP